MLSSRPRRNIENATEAETDRTSPRLVQARKSASTIMVDGLDLAGASCIDERQQAAALTRSASSASASPSPTTTCSQQALSPPPPRVLGTLLFLTLLSTLIHTAKRSAERPWASQNRSPSRPDPTTSAHPVGHQVSAHSTHSRPTTLSRSYMGWNRELEAMSKMADAGVGP